MGDDYKKAVKAVTNKLLTSKFITELGQKARVERSELKSEHMDKLRDVIADVGQDLLTVGAVPKGMHYEGSLTVHVYSSRVLKSAAFATINNLQEMTFDLADGALRELTGSTMTSFGAKRRALRSGF